MAGGKTYQVAQVDPLNPHTKGMVYQVDIVGGGTQMEELPEASADNVGQVYQYLGETGSGLTHGFFYESQALGTTPETYGWVAVNVQQGGAINSATTDLSNLTATGANISNWSSNVSNCITEIPQDINVSFSSNTITVLSGSKIYIPAGSGTYNSYTFSINQTRTAAYGKNFIVALLNKNDFSYNQVFAVVISKCCSGATDTLAGQAQHLWYDTTENIIKYYGNDGTTNSYYAAFPVCAVTGDNSGVIQSLDQVFNGAGYIGGEAFVLPGVKALIPEGFNADGTLKSSESSLTAVKIIHMNINVRRTINLVESHGAYDGGYTEVDDYGDMDSSNIPAYVRSMNQTFTQSTGAVQHLTPFVHFYRTTSGGVEQFDIAKPFHAVNYNDTDYIAHQPMPSGRYINLVLPTGGETVTAPADGWVCLNKVSGNANEFARLTLVASNMATSAVATDTDKTVNINLPVSKGDVVRVLYNLSGQTNGFFFVYANGSK